LQQRIILTARQQFPQLSSPSYRILAIQAVMEAVIKTDI
jgi:hypothetical protein